MGKAGANKLYRTFVRGLVSEASYLTYPEDSSFDESNTVLSRKGNRQRRFGMDYNTGNATARTYDATRAKNEFMWSAVGRNAALSFLCIQDGNVVSFYDRSQAAFAANVKSFNIDINLYCRPGISDAGTSMCKFASGKGFLFIVNPDIEPIVVSYDKITDTISVTKILILARDFEGLYDSLQNDEEPSLLSKQHNYNLLNQGWVNPRTSTVTG